MPSLFRKEFDMIETSFELKDKFKIDLMAITKGADGATLIKDEKTNHYELETKEVVDTLGAGDAFAAGMLSILSQKNSISYENFGRAMAEGNIWAACACQMLGGTGANPSNQVSALRYKLGERCEDEIETMDIDHAKKIIRFIDLAYQN